MNRLNELLTRKWVVDKDSGCLVAEWPNRRGYYKVVGDTVESYIWADWNVQELHEVLTLAPCRT